MGHHKLGAVSIRAASFEATATSASALGTALANMDTATMTIDADTIIIKSSAAGDGIGAGALAETEGAEGGSLVLGNENSETTITTHSTGGHESADGSFARSTGITASGEGASVVVNGKFLVINATGGSGVYAAGISVGDYSEKDEAADDSASVTINADSTTITADSTGIDAGPNARVTVNGSLETTAPTAIVTGGHSVVTINESGSGTVVLNGNIAFGNLTSGGGALDSDLSISLADSDSSWNGNSLVICASGSADTGVTGFRITLANGAAWNVADISDELSGGAEDGIVVEQLAVNKLTSDGGIISLTTGGAAEAEAITLTGDGLTIEVEGEGGVLEYGTMEETGGLTKTGSGTLTLSTGTAYTRTTSVEEGTLDVRDIDMASTSLATTNGATFKTRTTRSITSLTVDASDGGTATYDGDFSASGAAISFTTSGSGTAHLTVTGSADVTGASYAMSTADGNFLEEGTTLTLITAEGTLTADEGTTTADITAGSTTSQPVTIGKDGSSITGVAGTPGANEGSKALSESWLAGLALSTQGADLVANQGMASALEAVGAGNGIGAFVAMGGTSLRYATGSSVHMDGFSMMAGAAVSGSFSAGRATGAVFAEYGNGAYDAYNSFSRANIHGDGDAHYYGLGVLGCIDFAESDTGHPYIEASARIGRVSNEYDNCGLRNSSGTHAAFDSNTEYFGFHAGVGCIFKLTGIIDLDLYGKCLYTRQGSNGVSLSTGEDIRSDSAASSRVRVGARANWSPSNAVKAYVGAAFEHEFDGKADATTNGCRIKSPEMDGSTATGEVGVSLKPSDKVPFTLDANLAGYAGKRDGFTGSINFRLSF